MNPNPILVIGATGKTGARVAAKLEAKGHSVRRGLEAPPRPSTGTRPKPERLR